MAPFVLISGCVASIQGVHYLTISNYLNDIIYLNESDRSQVTVEAQETTNYIQIILAKSIFRKVLIKKFASW